MGLFDFFSKKTEKDSKKSKKMSERELARAARLIGNKMSQNYDRQDAIADLGAKGTAEAIIRGLTESEHMPQD